MAHSAIGAGSTPDPADNLAHIDSTATEPPAESYSSPAGGTPGEPGPWWRRLNRFQASGLHFGLSVLVFVSLVLLMINFWFPGKLFMLDGGWQGLKLVAMVDLILGPLLTLMLYNPEKRELLFDLAVILSIQLGALAYGFYTTYNERTLALVHADGAFTTVSASAHELANKELEDAELKPQRIESLNAIGKPALLLTPQEDLGKYMVGLLNGLPEHSERSDRYVTLDQAIAREALAEARLDREALENAGVLQAVEQVLSKRELTLENTAVYPFKARYANGYVLLNPSATQVLDYVVTEDVDRTAVAEQVE